VGNDVVEAPYPPRQRVGDVLGDPLAGLGGEADQLGFVAPDNVLELGDHVATGTAGRGDDAEVGRVEDVGVEDAGRGAGRHVEDDVGGRGDEADVDGALGAVGPASDARLLGGAMARRRPEGSLARMQGSETRACVSGSAGKMLGPTSSLVTRGGTASVRVRVKSRPGRGASAVRRGATSRRRHSVGLAKQGEGGWLCVREPVIRMEWVQVPTGR
jgi:hypothetical protein